MTKLKYGEWQPIETAPRDGTNILLLLSDEATECFRYPSKGQKAFLGYYVGEEGAWDGEFPNTWDIVDFNMRISLEWKVSRWHLFFDEEDEGSSILGWMPLPGAPEEKGHEY